LSGVGNRDATDVDRLRAGERGSAPVWRVADGKGEVI